MSFKNPWSEENNANASRNENPKEDHSNKTQNDVFENLIGKLFKGKQHNYKYIILALLVIIPLSGFYIVNPEEEAIKIRFGKYINNNDSGLHYKIPLIEKIIKLKTKRVINLSIGSKKLNKSEINDTRKHEGMMLTGDENIIDMNFEVQWKIRNIKKFIFDIKDSKGSIEKTSQSVIREIICNKKLAEVFTIKRGEIEDEAKEKLQKILDSYNSGVEIIIVQMLRADPPFQVIESFRDVQTARVDMEDTINQAMSYENDIIPRARGSAEEIIQKALAYKTETINISKAVTYEFNKLLPEYRKDKYIMKKKMLYNIIANSVKDTDKIIDFSSSGSNKAIMPYHILENKP